MGERFAANLRLWFTVRPRQPGNSFPGSRSGGSHCMGEHYDTPPCVHCSVFTEDKF